MLVQMSDDEFAEFEGLWPKMPTEETPTEQPVISDTSAKSNLMPVLAVAGLLLVTITLGGIYSLISGSDINQDDVDEDGISNIMDSCYDGERDWTSSLDTDHDGDGCRDASEDEDDDDDGLPDVSDHCATGELDWLRNFNTDRDVDGCRDASEDDDDDNDGVNDLMDLYPLDPTEWADSDGDGTGDNADPFPNDALEWQDSDGDGHGDNSDLFPTNPLEWVDFDQDGLGDNTDQDDDNDGVLDTYDINDSRDSAIYIRLERLSLLDNVDLFDSIGEIYFCTSVNNISIGCMPSYMSNYVEVETGTEVLLNENYHIDLEENLRYHFIEITAHDSDAFSDDVLDLNPLPNVEAIEFTFDSLTMFENLSLLGNGSADGEKDDGVLQFSIQPFDNLVSNVRDYYWDFDGAYYSLSWVLNYSTYASYRTMNHAIDWSNAVTYDDIIPQYAAFSTPYEPAIGELALELQSMAQENGYTSNNDVARFIQAFVGDIPYLYDLDSSQEQTEYPKYPIEMLWEEGGDCEDASALYISLVEHLGYDAALMLGDVKSNADEEWGGHAWVVIAMENYSGDGYMGEGDKSNVMYYFVETTGHYDGSSDIGINPWYDMMDEVFYDVE